MLQLPILTYGERATLTIDKYSVIQKLEQRGFSQAQAEGIVEALVPSTWLSSQLRTT